MIVPFAYPIVISDVRVGTIRGNARIERSDMSDVGYVVLRIDVSGREGVAELLDSHPLYAPVLGHVIGMLGATS